MTCSANIIIIYWRFYTKLNSYLYIFIQVLNDMARFLNSPINSHEVFVIRMSDTHNTNVDRLVEYLRTAFPGSGAQTGINDHYSRTGRWPTIQETIQQNRRVFVFAQDSLCNANCRTKYPFFLRVSTVLIFFVFEPSLKKNSIWILIIPMCF